MVKTTHISVLIDESSSMSGREKSIIDGFNEFISGLKADHAGDVRLSLLKFDLVGFIDPTEPIVRPVFEDKALMKVKKLKQGDYTPRGSTPLNDAVIVAIERMGGRVGKINKKEQAMLVIMTDGYENASKASSSDVKKLIQAKEKEGWQFLYLGANQDSWAESAKFGINAASTKNWTSDATGTRNMARAAGQSVSSLTYGADAYYATQAATPDNITNDADEIEVVLRAQALARKKFK